MCVIPGKPEKKQKTKQTHGRRLRCVPFVSGKRVAKANKHSSLKQMIKHFTQEPTFENEGRLK